jgi:chromosome segregation protein
MLKALELIGFKSFADKTRFEFDQGITVVVGPNGSGKSNVVDAIKWVMGEMSAKSLRGKEMTDVIFNGSSSRHALNSAEITLTLDNSKGEIGIDTPEVHITRRVYRNGEGEYCINRQPCRKKDIRDLLAGTGMGTGAYCIIEQGKVDSLLQSSPKDRRLIFEEAAGISRFRVKKVETLKRLERVEQNLLRLKDIVDEVENRVKTVRSQASKARRYREYTDRLQELRTAVGMADWRRLSEQLAAIEAELTALRDELTAVTAEAQGLESHQAECEAKLNACGERLSRCDGVLAETLAAIAAHDATVSHETAHCHDLEEEVSRHRRQLAHMNLRAGDLTHQWRETAAAVEAAEEDYKRLAFALAEDEHAAAEMAQRLEELRDANEQRRSEYMEQLRAVAALGNEISALESQAAGEAEVIDRALQRIAAAEEELQTLALELSRLREEQQRIAAVVHERRDEMAAVQTRLVEERSQHAAWLHEASTLRQRQAGMSERAALLRDLERRQEGLGTGAKDVLHQAQTAKRGPWRHVLGVVADLFHVNIQTAPLLELALGDCVGHVVIRREAEILEHLIAHSDNLAGRVSFIPFDPKDPPPDVPELDQRPGVVARADRFVGTSPEFRGLAMRLLGRTWIMENLAHALALARAAAQEFSADHLRFVTLAGEMVLPDGTLTLGPRQLSAGLISRRSELRQLEGQTAELQDQIDQVEAARGKLEQQIAADETELERLVAEHQSSSQALGECRHHEQALQQQYDLLNKQHEAVCTELVAAQQRQEARETTLAAARERVSFGERHLAELERLMAVAAREVIGLEQRRQDRAAAVTSAKIELAKSEERLENLRQRLHQFEKDHHERQRAIDEHRTRLALSAERLQQATRNILSAESLLASLYLVKESLSAEARQLAAEREAHRQARSEAAAAAGRLWSKARKLEEQCHGKDLAAGEIRLQRTALADRMRDDYGIELAVVEHKAEQVSSTEEDQQREQVEEEISELRRKIAGIGNVNLEALEELDELEKRYSTLSAQYEDLNSAKDQLALIINKINVDSRRLFAETLESIRGHFQSLFRKLFGGGQADIALEQGVDILESGVEINARPPGKELRSISLLSGGEKTLTCVAMLLAIFKSKPAPFCVLDEVDAALDEANIGRYTSVLKEFLEMTQFIVITHSKKTMTVATTLYGVTMQESGVSKRVSVRFEDVSDDGRITAPGEASQPPAATEAEEETQAA